MDANFLDWFNNINSGYSDDTNKRVVANNTMPNQLQAQRNVNALIAPFQNVQNNLTKTYSDFTNPQGSFGNRVSTDIADVYNLKHNPTGNWNGIQQTPTPDDKHLGPANENGVRPISPSYFQSIGIPDNSNLLIGRPSIDASQPTNSSPQQQKSSGVGWQIASKLIGDKLKKNDTDSSATDSSATSDSSTGQTIASYLKSLL